MRKLFFCIVSVLPFLFCRAQITFPGNVKVPTGASYPSHIDSLGFGGYRAVNTLSDRDAITPLRRKYGMAVYVKDTDSLYILKSPLLDNTSWFAFKSATIPAWTDITGKPSFFSGAYDDLTGKPTLNLSNWNTAFSWGNHAGLYRPIGYVPAWTDITGKPSFFSGAYDDLTGKPTLNLSNWNTAFSWGNHAGLYRPIGYVPAWTDITGKPSFFSGAYDDLTGKPTLNLANWNTSYSWGNHAGLYIGNTGASNRVLFYNSAGNISTASQFTCDANGFVNAQAFYAYTNAQPAGAFQNLNRNNPDFAALEASIPSDATNATIFAMKGTGDIVTKFDQAGIRITPNLGGTGNKLLGVDANGKDYRTALDPANIVTNSGTWGINITGNAATATNSLMWNSQTYQNTWDGNGIIEDIMVRPANIAVWSRATPEQFISKLNLLKKSDGIPAINITLAEGAFVNYDIVQNLSLVNRLVNVSASFSYVEQGASVTELTTFIQNFSIKTNSAGTGLTVIKTRPAGEADAVAGESVANIRNTFSRATRIEGFDTPKLEISFYVESGKIKMRLQNTDLSTTLSVSGTFNVITDGASSTTINTLVDPTVPDHVKTITTNDILNWNKNIGGTYTPTLTGVTNIASLTANKARYTRNGNIVDVSGSLQIQTTSTNTYSVFKISLPIASTFYQEDASGLFTLLINQGGGSVQNGYILGATDKVDCMFKSAGDNNGSISYSFKYEIK